MSSCKTVGKLLYLFVPLLVFSSEKWVWYCLFHRFVRIAHYIYKLPYSRDSKKQSYFIIVLFVTDVLSCSLMWVWLWWIWFWFCFLILHMYPVTWSFCCPLRWLESLLVISEIRLLSDARSLISPELTFFHAAIIPAHSKSFPVLFLFTPRRG